MKTTSNEVLERALVAIGWVTAAAVTYLLAIAAAAATTPRRRLSGRETSSLRFLILIPAHDEERVLPATLDAVAALAYPADQVRVTVIADNCSDATADVARERGAEVLVRHADERGKGPALAWALQRLGDGGAEHDAVLFLDADCLPSSNLLNVVAERMTTDGAGAVQADYVVANPSESWASGLRFASFALVNTVRPIGKDRLGLSAGISGTGFAVRDDVLDRVGWTAFSLTEDTEYHLRLLEAGVPVRFAREAAVRSHMLPSLSAARGQVARWESGKTLMLRRWSPQLLSRGLQRRDPQLLHAALEGVVPSQAGLAASSVVVLLGGMALRSTTAARLGVLTAAGQGAYVLAGLRIVRAPRVVYRSLVYAPFLVIWKLGLKAGDMTRRRPREWERALR